MFTSEVVSSPSARRVSERKHTAAPLDKSFFKKTYKSKPAISNMKEQTAVMLPIEPSLHETAAALLFLPVCSSSRQAKAIRNYRTKKLKKMIANKDDLAELIKIRRCSGVVFLSALRKVAPNGKANYAASRARDSEGRFNSELIPSKNLSILSKSNSRDDCLIESGTTADCSFLDVLSLSNSHDHDLRTKGHDFFDFDSLYQDNKFQHRGITYKENIVCQENLMRGDVINRPTHAGSIVSRSRSEKDAFPFEEVDKVFYSQQHPLDQMFSSNEDTHDYFYDILNY